MNWYRAFLREFLEQSRVFIMLLVVELLCIVLIALCTIVLLTWGQ